MAQSEYPLEKYYQDVFRFLRGISADEHLAEELAQETICRALKSIDSYRGEANFRVWLCSIAKNLYYSHCRRKRHESDAQYIDNLAADDGDFTRMIVDRETALRLHKILHGLGEPYKEIFSLRIFGELSFREIGELFGKTEHWACVTYHRAKRMMQAAMKKQA